MELVFIPFLCLFVQFHTDGLFDKSAIKEFVFANKLPLVTNFSRESATLIFESPIKKQVLLFATSNGSSKVFPTFVDAAKLFKGKVYGISSFVNVKINPNNRFKYSITPHFLFVIKQLIFVYVELDNEDVGKPVGDYFGITGDAPQVRHFSIIHLFSFSFFFFLLFAK